MTDEQHRRDDLAGLEPEEAESLGGVVDTLRRQRPVPGDPHFFDTLQQRIINHMAVTPLPRRRSGWPARLAGAVGRLLSAPAFKPAALVAAGLAAVLALMLVQRAPVHTPVHELPTPQQILSQREQPTPTPLAQAVPTYAVPDDLWEAGFLSDRAASLDDLEAAVGLSDALPAPPDQSEPSESSAASDDDAAQAALESDVFASDDEDGSWALDNLTDDELRELDNLLGG